jgi:hypothetical protein
MAAAERQQKMARANRDLRIEMQRNASCTQSKPGFRPAWLGQLFDNRFRTALA